MKRALFLGCWVLVSLMLASAAQAKKVEIMPNTEHSALTLTTDESYGYQVLPGKPLQLDLVGPGKLKVTVRLNNKSKRSVFSGRFEIKRGKRRIKRSRLKLHRSRVGAYKEASGLHPSLPKVFKIKVPRGVQSYTFSIRAPRSTSMTLLLEYESRADQSAARRDSDVLALVPVEPEKKPEKTKTKTKEVAARTKPPVEKPAEKPEKKPIEKPETAVKTTPKEKPAVVAGERKPGKSGDKKLALDTSGTGVRTIETKAPEPPEIEKKGEAESIPVVSLGLKFGQISPLQKVGGTTYTGSLDVRYILPVWEGRLTLGVEAGYYNYEMAVTTERRDISMMIIPIALQIFYRLPIHTFIEPYVGLGGDVFVCMGEDKNSDTDFTYSSQTAFVFGGHIVAGLEAELGPGFLLAEVRAGMSFGDPGVWENNPNIYGLLAVAGYRFVF